MRVMSTFPQLPTNAVQFRRSPLNFQAVRAGAHNIHDASPTTLWTISSHLLSPSSFAIGLPSHLLAETPVHAPTVPTPLIGRTPPMSSDPFSHDRPRSPTPLALWATKAQASPNKGQKAIYPHRSWVRGRDPSPEALDSNAASPVKPSLLARISDPTNNGQEQEAHGDNYISEDAQRVTQREWMEGIEETGEVLEVSVVGGKSQDELSKQTMASGICVKTEETPVVIPSPTRSEFSAGRKRGSRSTIDVVSIFTYVSRLVAN